MKVRIDSPTPNEAFGSGPVVVTGRADTVTTSTIDSVTVQVDSQAPVDTPFTPVAVGPPGEAEFSGARYFSTVQPPATGSHRITVTATDSARSSGSASVVIQTGRSLNPGPAAVLLEILADIDPSDKKLRSELDKAIAPLRGKLPSGFTLFGPGLTLTTNRDGSPLLRIAVWIGGISPLPFTDESASLGFSATPILLARSGTPPPGVTFKFGLSIPLATLNTLMAIALPSLTAAASKAGVPIDSISVACTPPNLVTATVRGGQVGFPPADVTVTITETLGTTGSADPCTGAPVIDPATGAPAMALSSATNVSAGTDVLTQALLGIIMPVFLAEATVVTVAVPLIAGGSSGRVGLIVAGILGNIPPSIPFKSDPDSLITDFPKVALNWTRFGASATGIFGLGTLSLATRSPCIKLSGPHSILGRRADGGVDQPYSAIWSEILPDTFSGSVSPPPGSLSQGQITPSSGDFTATFEWPETPLTPLTFKAALNLKAVEIGHCISPPRCFWGVWAFKSRQAKNRREVLITEPIARF